MRHNLDIRLYLIRHGQTERNANPNLIGQVPEEPLNEAGKQQAKLLGERFKKNNLQFDTIYCSPYKRAEETRDIATPIGMNYARHFSVPALKEIYQGDGIDKNRNEVYTPEFKDHFDFMGMAAHFPNGECMFEVEHRATKWLEDEILENPFTRSDKPLNIAIYTHGITIKCFLHHFMNFDHRFTWRININNTSITTLHAQGGDWFLEGVNDTSHLIIR